ncbi:MAG: MBL fold metallo-hydrolase, partial [Clostridia bacterium]|nr:MBL fold metallo-hydrolase [Clostridia bacterium]
MASSKGSKRTDKTQKVVKKAVKSAVSGGKKKKGGAANKKLIIAVAVIVVILIIALLAVYFIKPEIYAPLLEILGIKKPESDNKPGLSEGTLQMSVIDVGQGDCIFIAFPDGQTMIMDAGTELGTPSRESDIAQVIDDMQISAIDYLFITHSDYDHVRYAASLLAKYEFKNIYIPKVADDMSATWTKTIQAIRDEKYTDGGQNKSAEINYNIGEYTISGQAWKMRCYSYDEEDYPDVKKSSSALVKNAVSPVCLLEYAGRTIILTGDSNERNEPYLINKGHFDNVDADVLKVAHHGSKTSTCDEFLDKVDCEYAIVSYGDGNDYGHPTPELMG